MLSLTYLSRAVAPWTDPQLAGLLQQARAANERSALTGMLLHCHGTFIQTLEGHADDVDARFTLIDADPRHFDVFILHRDHIDRRAFVGWYMAYASLSHAEAARSPGFTDYLATGRVDGDEPRLAAVAGFHRTFHAHGL